MNFTNQQGGYRATMSKVCRVCKGTFDLLSIRSLTVSKTNVTDCPKKYPFVFFFLQMTELSVQFIFFPFVNSYRSLTFEIN